MSDIDAVEAVARAICVAEKMNPDDALGCWVHWIDAAKAAIEAVDGDLEFRIAKLELGPRDVLVVKTAYHIAREVVERIRITLADDAGLTNKIMVIGPDLDLAVLTRAEIESRIAPQSEDAA